MKSVSHACKKGNTNMLTHGNRIRKDGEGEKTKPKKKKKYHGET